jgi:uncharacterized protein (DUF608 family)
MPKTIHKFEINGGVVEMPVGSVILNVDFQTHVHSHAHAPTGSALNLYLWAEFDSFEKRKENRLFQAYATGDDKIPHTAKYIGSAQYEGFGSQLVLHAYELIHADV